MILCSAASMLLHPRCSGQAQSSPSSAPIKRVDPERVKESGANRRIAKGVPSKQTRSVVAASVIEALSPWNTIPKNVSTMHVAGGRRSCFNVLRATLVLILHDSRKAGRSGAHFRFGSGGCWNCNAVFETAMLVTDVRPSPFDSEAPWPRRLSQPPRRNGLRAPVHSPPASDRSFSVLGQTRAGPEM